jgi:hypothetical protein
MPITVYDSVNNIADLPFIAGTDKTLTFTCYAENGIDKVNLTGATVTWYLCPWGQTSIISLQKTGTLTDPTNGVFTITILDTDTTSFSGKYIQQLSIQDVSGKVFRPGQGLVFISPAIHS